MTFPVFMFWNDTDVDKLRATGFAAFGTRWEAAQIGSMHIVILRSEHIDNRTDLDKLHANLMVFPGPNGKMQKKHASFISKEFPNVKEGDPFSSILSLIYTKTGLESFNPDAY